MPRIDRHILLLLSLCACGTTAPTDPEPTAAATACSTLVGRVVDANGHAIAGASVTSETAGLHGLAPGSAVWRDIPAARLDRVHTETDTHGRFVLTVRAPGRHVLRAGHADGCMLTSAPIALPVAGERLDVGTLTLPRGAVVTGRLVYARVQAFELRLARTDAEADVHTPWSAALPVAYSGPDGSYRFPGRVPPGAYTLHGTPWNEQAPFGNVSNFGAFAIAIEVPVGVDTVQVPAVTMRL